MTPTDTAQDPALNDEADRIAQQLLTSPPDDPYPLLNRLREIAPVHRLSTSGTWTVATYDLIEEVLKDKRFVRDWVDMTKRQLGDNVDFSRPMLENRSWQFQFSNPPEYIRKRAVYAKFLTPAAVERLRDEIALYANQQLDLADSSGELELVEKFSYGLTLNLVCRITGFPPPEGEAAVFLEWFRAWGDTFQAVVTPPMLDAADEAINNLHGMMSDRLAAMRRHPGDNLITMLMNSEYNGAPLSDDEIIANAILMFAASVGTTADLISNAVVCLMQHREQWDMVTRDPAGMAARAVEETLRYDSSVLANPPTRLAAEDVVVGGATIPAGDVVFPLYGAGNRDPQHYEDPERFDITREDIRPLSFGGGVHVCPGQHLARAQCEVALQVLATRFPNMTLVDADPPRRANPAQRGAAELRVRLA